MRALFIEHDHVSPPGAIGDGMADLGYDIDEFVVVPRERFATPDVDAQFPPLDDYDAVITMGAPWSVYDDSLQRTWVGTELDLLREADRRDLPVLGICFGGQLLAAAHGGSVARSPVPELGWHVVLSADPTTVASGPWFQWHFDRWALPPRATEVARNAAGSQAFRVGRSFAVQFHPELDVDMLEGWLANGGRAPLDAAGLDVDTLVRHTRDEQGRAAERARHLVAAVFTH